MKFEYVSAYRLLGIAGTANHLDKEMVRLPKYEATATLTVNPDEHCYNVDRFNAITMLIQKMAFQALSQEDSFAIQLEKEILRIQATRRERYGTGAYLIFRASGAIEVADIDIQDTILSQACAFR